MRAPSGGTGRISSRKRLPGWRGTPESDEGRKMDSAALNPIKQQVNYRVERFWNDLEYYVVGEFLSSREDGIEQVRQVVIDEIVATLSKKIRRLKRARKLSLGGKQQNPG